MRGLLPDVHVLQLVNVLQKIDHRPLQNPVKSLQNLEGHVGYMVYWFTIMCSITALPKTLIRGDDVLYVR
jgi:hypothetical protein